MARPKFVAGNWKMYTDLAGAKSLAAAVAKEVGSSSKVQVAVCPPAPWLTAVADAVKGSAVVVGAQNCHFEKEGAFTGELAPQMVLGAGCKYVLIGHSERRHGLGETDDLLNKKARAALAAGLHVIFCIGELLAERESNHTESVLDRQISFGLADVPPEQMANLVIAYEPVWAIGTGKVATPEQAQAAHAFVRGKIVEMFGEKVASELLIQYGGSVKPDNAVTILHQPDVDGALVGGASLKADSFLAIVKAAG
ncbi:triose-phosphate isomerase [Limnoglobus roseus]|uniref:Triosephosphate isomerase n=1 Tax=Limnoglobus roseus TaxID=2598579 RepID=A0A5C1AD18_9BACT|nr:triose-phosphate isomerase [Limnoglobus roseus]QEL17249.1 triose-phosphate isomerase [Limnoglobus roseus]